MKTAQPRDYPLRLCASALKMVCVPFPLSS
jgi:hypothetical protein